MALAVSTLHAWAAAAVGSSLGGLAEARLGHSAGGSGWCTANVLWAATSPNRGVLECALLSSAVWPCPGPPDPCPVPLMFFS